MANLVAQVGYDISQFKIGMKEVAATLRLTELRSKEAQARVQSYLSAQQRFADASVRSAQASRAVPVQRYRDNLDKVTQNLDAAQQRLAAASARVGALQATATAKQIASANTAFEAANARADAAINRFNSAQDRLAAGIARRDALRRKALYQQEVSTSYGGKAIATDQFARAVEDVAKARAARYAEDAEAHRIRSINAIAAEAQKAGVIITAALGASVKVGADFNQQLVTAAHNTSLTASGVKLMAQTVKELGTDSGSDLSQLAHAFQLVENYGYSAAQSVDILTIANKASVAYGSELSKTTELLAQTMKEFSIPAQGAATTMGILAETANKAPGDLETLVKVFGQMTASSSNLGVSLLETAAAYIVFTRHGLNVNRAATQFRADIERIINPSEKSKRAIAQLSKATGVDLTRDFSTAGLRARQLSGVFTDLELAASKFKGGVIPADIVSKIFPQQRGQLGAIIATGTGSKEYVQVLDNLRQKTTDGTNINDKYTESLAQTNQQLQRLKNSVIVVSSSVALAFAPSISEGVKWVTALTADFNRLDAAEKNNLVKMAAMVGVGLIVVGVLGKLVVGVQALNAALVAMELGGLAGIAGPIAVAVAAVGLFTLAIWGTVRALDVYDRSAQREAERAGETAQRHVVASQAGLDHARQISGLVEQYNRLAEQHRTLAAAGRPTGEVMRQMQSVLDQIAGVQPNLISGFDQMGHAIGLVGNAARRTADELAGMMHASMQSQSMAMAATAQQAGVNVDNLTRWRDLLAHRLREGTAPTGALRQATQAEINANDPALKRTERLAPFVQGGTSNYSMPVEGRASDADKSLMVRQLADANSKLAQQLDVRDTLNQRAADAIKIPITQADFNARNLEQLHTDVTTYRNYLDNAITATEKARNAITAAAAGHPAGEMGIPARQLEEMRVVHGRAIHAQMETARRYKLAQDTLAKREHELAPYDPFHIDKRPTAPGDDPTAGLGDKAKAARRTRESEAERDTRRMQDRYQALMEGFVQQQFLAQHVGKEGEALWETQAHGTILLADGVHKVNGEFVNYNKTLRDNLVLAAKKDDQRRVDEKWAELQKTNALKQFELGAGPAGRTPTEIAAFRAGQGAYKDYGKHATEAMFSDIKIGNMEREAKAQDQLNKLNEESARPLQKQSSVYDEFIKKIREAAYAYEVLGEEGARNLAITAQHNADMAAHTKLYTDTLDEANTALQKQLELSKGNVGEAATYWLELQGKAYSKLTLWEKLEILLRYQQIDASRKKMEIDKAQLELSQRLEDQQKQAQYNAIGATNPARQKLLEYMDQGIQSIGEAYKLMNQDQQKAARDEIRSSFERIEQLDKYAAAEQKVADLMKDVKDRTSELTSVWKVNSDGLKVSREDWKGLTVNQRHLIEQFLRIKNVHEQVSEALTGIDQLFSSTLQSIRDNGFGSFFRDILKGFDDLLFSLAQKWLTSQFTQLINGGLGSLLGGLLGGGAGTPPIIGNDFPGLGSGLQFAADGGAAVAGRAMVVGERGPELFVPGSHGNIVPNGQYGGNTYHLHVHGVQDLPSWRQSEHQIVQSLSRRIAGASRR